MSAEAPRPVRVLRSLADRSAGLRDRVTVTPATGLAPPETLFRRRRYTPRHARYQPLGGATWCGLLALLAGVALLLTSVAGALSRTGTAGALPLFWAGVLLMILPGALRLSTHSPQRGERIVILVIMGLALYLSKVLHDPFAFTYPDEFMHLRNAMDVSAQNGLFARNSVLPVSPYYPGLATLAAALSKLTGLGLFPSGLAVIGVARLLMVLSLFLMMERIAGSSRVASAGTVVYMANSNFLFWSAQFSYQSLALPLAVFAAYLFAARSRTTGWTRRLEWGAASMVAILAVVMTHHLTAFALATFFVAASVASRLGMGKRREGAWGLAAFTLVAGLLWLLEVAPVAREYLGYIIGTAMSGTFDAVTGGESRRLFQSTTGAVTPAWERLVALGSVAFIALVLPFGLRRAWQRRGRSATLVVAAAAGATFLAVLPLRLVPSAWETANRTSDYLFIGVGITIALSGLHLNRRRRMDPLRATLTAAFLAVVFVGGVLAGWPPATRLPLPYEGTLAGRVVHPQGYALGAWAGATLPANRRWLADESSGRFLLTLGHQLPLSAREGATRTLFEATYYTPELAGLMRARRATFAAIDRRAVSGSVAGVFFPRAGQPLIGPAGPVDPVRVELLNKAPVDRRFDSGDIVAYDLRVTG